jgi:hypothetical protein
MKSCILTQEPENNNLTEQFNIKTNDGQVGLGKL